MAFPVVEATAQGRSAGNSFVHLITMPAVVNAGDLLVCGIATDGAVTITWTDAGLFQIWQGNHAGAVTMGGAYRIADGSEGGGTLRVDIDVLETACWITYRLSGYEGLPECGVQVTGNSTTPDPPNLAPSWGAQDTIWLPFEGNDGWSNVTAYPLNYTDGLNEVWPHAVAGLGIGTARRELNAAAENPGVFTLDTGYNWVAQTVAVRGSGGAGNRSKGQVGLGGGGFVSGVRTVSHGPVGPGGVVWP